MTRQYLRPLAFPIVMIKLYNLVIWKEQVFCSYLDIPNKRIIQNKTYLTRGKR
jgi:hypothetical protein